jgi:hypothetical protein
MRTGLLKVLLVSLFLSLVSVRCFALINWTGGTSGDWGTASNWSTGAVPVAGSTVQIGVVGFTNQPTVAGNYKCASLIFGSLQAATLTVNSGFTLTVTGNITQNFATGTAGTSNTSPTTLTFTTSLAGAGAITCVNLVIGDGTVPANYSANLFQVSSQISQFTITGNIQLNAVGNGSATKNNQNYPAFTIDNNITTLNGKIITNSTGNPTSGYYYTYNPYIRYFQGVGTVSTNNAYSATGVANTNNTTFELTYATPIANPTASYTAGFYIIFDGQGTGVGQVLYDASTASGPQTIYTANDVPYYNSVYNYLSITTGSTKNVDAGTLSVGYEGGNLKTMGGAVNFNANNTVVTAYNDWNNYTTVNQGAGAFNITGNITNNAAGVINGSTTAATTTVGGKYTNNGTSTWNAESVTITGSAPNAGTFTAGSGAIGIGGTCVNTGTFAAGSGTVTITGKFTNTGGAITGPTGVGSAMYFNGIFLQNSGSFTGNDGYIDFNGNYKLLTGTFAAGSGEVEYDGNYTDAGTYTAGTGLAYFGGKSTQKLLDSSSTGGTVWNNVTFYCKATLNLFGTGLFAVSPTGILTVYDDGAYNAKLTAGDNTINATTADAYLTLRSNATSSAAVAPLTGGTSIAGNVNVQRYITGGTGYRGYRLLSSPVFVYGTADYSLNYPINNSYLKGSTGTGGGFDAAGNPNLYLFRENLVPSNTSFISGNWRGVNAINNSTAYNYSFDSESGTYNIYPGQGFLFFFRGSRKVATLATEGAATYTPTVDTLTATGILNQGAVAAKYWYTNSTSLGYTVVSSPSPGNGTVIGFNCVGNPYASSIDLNTASTTAGSGITITPSVETNFYELNPSSQNYDVWDVALNTGTNDATEYIMSGQGFFAKADATGQTITFNENAKNTAAQNVNPYLFMAKRVDPGTLNQPDNAIASQPAVGAAAPSKAIDVAFLPKNIAAAAVVRNAVLAVVPPDLPKNKPLPNGALAPGDALKRTAGAHTIGLASAGNKRFLRLQLKLDDHTKDDILINFNDSAKAVYTVNQDAMHRPGNGAVILSSMSADNVPLAINQLPWPKRAPVVIPLNVYAGADGAYAMKLKDTLIIPKLYEVWLMDAYKKDSLDIRNNPQYLFDLSLADTNSYGNRRFSLVVRQNQALMVHLLKFTALKANGGSRVNWTTENEANYTGFSVERSTDGGKTFNSMESVTSSSVGNYTYFDTAPVLGANLYRLKLTDLNGTVSYSAVVTVMFANNNNIAINGLMVYPNPTGGMVNLSISQAAPQSTASYRIQIVNGVGAVIKTVVSSQPVWQSDVSALAPGTYFISVVSAADNKMIGKSAFVKL